RERALRSEPIEAVLVDHRLLLELFALADIELQAGYALKLPASTKYLGADTLDPHIMTAAMQHADLNGKTAHSIALVARNVIGRGCGIVRVNEPKPAVVGVDDLGLVIAQEAFPGRRIVNLPTLEIEVEKPDCSLIG